MARNFLAFLGLVFLLLIIVAGLAVVAYYYDALGLVELPEEMPTRMAQVPTQMAQVPTRIVEVIGTREVKVEVIGIGTAEWRNPLDDLPTATWSPTETPWPTPTPVPPLDPAEYRTEVILNLKKFTAALEGWLDANRALAQDNTLLDNTAWREDMAVRLEDISASAEEMAEVGPPPEEYQAIARMLARVSEAASALQSDYSRAMETRGADDFRKAGEDFERIKAYLQEAVQAMLEEEWVIE